MIAAAAALCAAFAHGATVKVPLKTGWRFAKADDPAAGTNLTIKAMSSLLDRAARGDTAGAPDFGWAKPGFDDSSWKVVRVPHDWGVDEPFDSGRPYGDAFLDVTGVGWYRLQINVPADWNGRKVYFECDGAMSYAMLYLNGRFLGGWPYGYTRWRVDLTEHLNLGGENTIAIRCHNVPHSSRWYTGGGLYRDCRLLVCPEDHVVPGSVFITTPEVTAKRAKVRVRYEMSKSGKREKSFAVENPRLWDVDDPYLYTVDVEGDAYRYGIRTIAFHSDERRFQLNGRTVPLNGVSMHHDFGVLGAAWNRAAQRRRLLLFKEAGVNAVRSSHNPPDEGLLELCDELGILVKDEVFDEWRKTGASGKRKNGYTNLFDTWHERDLRGWVRTDLGARRPQPSKRDNVLRRQRDLRGVREDCAALRVLRAGAFAGADGGRGGSHPALGQRQQQRCELHERLSDGACADGLQLLSVAVSGACEEVPRRAVLRLRDRVHERDARRVPLPCLADLGEQGEVAAGLLQLGLLLGGCRLDATQRQLGVHAGRAVVLDGRGRHLHGRVHLDRHRLSRRPVLVRLLAQEAELHQSRGAETRACGSEGARHDARGDPHLQHRLPRPGRLQEGLLLALPVAVASRLPDGAHPAALELEGTRRGGDAGLRVHVRRRGRVWDRAYRLRWDDVRYEPGVLEAVVYKDGREWARDVVKTTGSAAKLVLETESPALLADGEDVCYVNVSVRDAEGLVVPNAKVPVKFSVEGPGEIVATDNGDETDFDDFRRPDRKTFNGWAQVIVRAIPGRPGDITVKAMSDGLAAACATIKSRRD